MLTHETNKTLKAKAKLKKQAANASTETITAAPSFDEVSNGDDEKIDWSLSGKLLVLGKILPLWHREGHKVLIFCQMHSMLNLVEKMLRDLGVIYLRMDGHTPVQKRQGIIRDFNNIPDIFVLLLTSRTGGVGISLTAANRVILVDPDFNPQTDIQVNLHVKVYL
jgi:DNA excision repair protein ERCC-6